MDRPTKSSPLSPVIFDTDILIEYLRGSAKARSFLRSVSFPARFLSVVVFMELLQGSRSSQESIQLTHWVKSNFYELWHIDEDISRKAVSLVQQYAKSHGLRLADALIAATAFEKGATLATGNVQHFKMANLLLLPFHP